MPANAPASAPAQAIIPLRQTAVFTLAELVSRTLGLLFLARFVQALGLVESADFRIALPLLGTAAALTTIGIPQALTRLFATLAANESPAASDFAAAPRIPHAALHTALHATLLGILLTLAALFALHLFAAAQAPAYAHYTALLLTALPLLALLALSGSLRGILYGLGSTYAPACAQVLEVAARLLALLLLTSPSSRMHDFLPPLLHTDGLRLGLFILTLSEVLVLFFLSACLCRRLRRHGLTRSDDASRASLRDTFRMALSPTGQALLASLGFALELPLLRHLLAEGHSPMHAEHLVAEYAAIALPLLCYPMVFTDALATALLPAAATVRARDGSRALTRQLHTLIGTAALLALPVTALFLALAPQLTGLLFAAPDAAPLLLLLAPLALPLYLNHPLSALLQAHGFSRALLLAGLAADFARLGTLYLAVHHLHLDRAGIALAYAASTLLQTALLLYMASRLAPLRLPWRTLFLALQLAVILYALLLPLQ